MNLGSRFAFSKYLSYTASVVLAYMVGMTIAFLLMRLFVFDRSRQSLPRQMSYFVAVNVVGLFVTVGTSVMVSRLAHSLTPDRTIDEMVGHFVGVCAPVMLSFFAHKYVTFR